MSLVLFVPHTCQQSLLEAFSFSDLKGCFVEKGKERKGKIDSKQAPKGSHGRQLKKKPQLKRISAEACLCTCLCTCLYTCHSHVCTHVCTNVCTLHMLHWSICMSACPYRCACTCPYTCLYTYLYIFLYTCLCP